MASTASKPGRAVRCICEHARQRKLGCFNWSEWKASAMKPARPAEY